MSDSNARRAEVLGLKARQLALEREIEDLFRTSVKRKDIVFDRNEDWGKRGFMVNIFFDEFGVATFRENMERVVGLVAEYQRTRAEENRAMKRLAAEGFDAREELARMEGMK